MMDDQRPKFVGIFEGDCAAHGPAQNECGVWMNCTYNGTSTWAVDDRGNVYNYAQDVSVRYPRPRRYVWEKVAVDVVYDPGPRTEIP